MRITIYPLCTWAILLPLCTISFVSQAQPPAARAEDKKAVLSIAYYIESANNSLNSLSSLLKKDNYRNKITSLNNPANNELGFSLKNEILNALKPLLDKAKRTDSRKFRDVIENFLGNPEDNGIPSAKKYMPALGIFSTVLSLVGNLVINERGITRDDLNEFVGKIQQYFSQYEKLNTINEEFGAEVQELLTRSEEIKTDLRDFLLDCVCTMDKSLQKAQLADMTVELIIQRYYDPQKLQFRLDTCTARNSPLYPPDAATSIKLLTSGIKKLQKEFEKLYSTNYRQLKELIASLKNTLPNLDEKQLEKTSSDIDLLYSESRKADMINLNMSLVDERMNTACTVIQRNW